MSCETDQAILLGNDISTYLTQAMIDDYAIGDKEKADEQARDACLVRALVDVLEFYNLNGADTEFTQAEIAATIANIHEYEYALLLDIDDFAFQAGDSADALGTGGTVVVLKSGTIVSTPHTYSWTVASDGETIYTMPFDIGQIDSDSLYLTLNEASNPLYNTDYTIVGTTFTWTGEYPLSAGWIFELKYEI